MKRSHGAPVQRQVDSVFVFVSPQVPMANGWIPKASEGKRTPSHAQAIVWDKHLVVYSVEYLAVKYVLNARCLMVETVEATTRINKFI